MAKEDIKAKDLWDIEISPKRKWFDFNYKEIWRARDLLQMLVLRDFKAFYKQTILGPLWFFVQPMFTTGMYIFVFGNLAGLSTVRSLKTKSFSMPMIQQVFCPLNIVIR